MADNVQKTALDKTQTSHVEYDQPGQGPMAADQTPVQPRGFWSWWQSLRLGVSGNVIVVIIIIGIVVEIVKKL